MDYAALKIEIDSDPAGRGYQGQTPEVIADLLNEPYKTTFTPLPINDVLEWAVEVQAFSRLEAIANDNPLYDAAKGFLLLLQGRDVFNVGKPRVLVMLDAFVVAGIITGAQKQDLLDLAAVEVSRAEELSLGQVWPGHVAEALAR